jgi:hypothetical protein
MATCVVSGTIQSASETAISGVTIRFRITAPIFNSTISTYVPKEITATTTTDGSFSITLARSISGVLSIEYPPNATDSARRYDYSITVPNSATSTLGALVTEY